jgi:hypothetical protein
LVPPPSPELVVASVYGYSIQPGAEGRSPRKLLGFAVDGYERLLDRVEGRFSVCEDPQAYGEHSILVGSHELLE